jgi:Nucleoside-diphosphate-sugar epimerases
MSYPSLTVKNILVTGGAGFIGSNLCEELLRQGNRVTCLDNFSTGKHDNIASFLENPKFTLIEGDIRNYEDCQRAVKGVDLVFHEAALGSVPRSINDPIISTDVNIGGFVKMLFAAKEEGVKRFIYAASSSTYGDHPALPKVEENIGKPLSPYAITKYVNELYAENFSKLYGIETIGLRYFNVFGKRQDPDGAYAAVIPKFAKMLIEHQQPVINGDGNHSRDFTHIENVVLMNLLAATTQNQKAVNQVFNTACGERNTLNQLVTYLKEFLSEFDPAIESIVPVFGKEREGDVLHSLASIEKAKNYLGYTPACLFKEGLRRSASWYFQLVVKQ